MRSVRRRPAALVLLLCWLNGASCCSHEHIVGLGPTGSGEFTERQYYLFFGLLPLQEVNTQNLAQNLTSYSVETRFSLMDLLLFPVLLPLTGASRTVTVRT